MSKKMICPMSFPNERIATQFMNAETEFKPMECNPDCAWAKNNGYVYWCGIINTDTKAALASVNSRPLKDGNDE